MRWRPILYDLAAPVAACLCVPLIALVLAKVASVLARSNLAQVRIEAELAELAADTAATSAIAGCVGAARGAPSTTSIESAGFTCLVSATDDARGRRLTIRALGRTGRTHGFTCEVLQGAAPSPFGRCLSLGHFGGPRPEVTLPDSWPYASHAMADETDFPRLDPELCDHPAAPPPASGLMRHDAIALLRLKAGTDNIDYAFRVPPDGLLRPELPPSGVVCIDGHLWLDAGEPALTLMLDRPLTIVVSGNIYLGRSLTVLGKGRLVLVARQWRSGLFRDRDGDGRRTLDEPVLHGRNGRYEGCMEGTGAAYLGLNGTAVPQLDIDACLVARGDVYLAARHVTIHGAVVVGEAITPTLAGAQLTCTGEHLPDVERDRVPGFLTSGRERHSRLTAWP